MVKLLRLTTENNLKFEADLDAGIDVNENSQIAIQNLTFESSDFSALNINGGNNTVSFSLDRDANVPPYDFLTNELSNVNYKKSNITDLYKDLEATLNSCLKVSSTTGDAYGCFKILYPGDGSEFGQVEKVTIIFKLTPMIMAFHYNDTGDRRSYDPIQDPDAAKSIFAVALFPDTRIPYIDIGQDEANGGVNLGNSKLVAGVLAQNELKFYGYAEFPWSSGSGMWMVRLQNLIDNTGAKDTNGFCVGLAVTEESSLDILVDDNNDIIPDSIRNFEVRVYRPTDTYDIIINATATPTAVTPNSFITANGLANDHILFERDGAELTISILQSTNPGGVKTVIHTHTFSRAEMNKNIFPYFSIFGEDTNAELGHPILTLNPIINPFKLDPLFETNDQMAITGLTQSILGGDNAFEAISGDYSNVIPDLQNELFEDDEVVSEYNPQIKVNGAVLRAMGFDQTTYPNNIIYTIQKPLTTMNIDDLEPEGQIVQFNLIADGLSVLVNSDNYIVILDSNPLYSYDASRFDYANQNNIVPKDKKAKRGRRLNILATIPINDNNGFVEFNANELVYIDLDNKFPQNIKNLRLRVLNKNFDEVETNGESIITLLIKDN